MLSEIVEILNNNGYQFKVVSTVPTYVGNEGEMVLYAAGATRRIYTYINGQWTYTAYSETTGYNTIEIGSGSNFIGGDDVDGFWVGAATYASAPFKVSLAGVISATSGTIGGWDLSASTLSSANDKIILDDTNELITVGDTGGIYIKIDGVNTKIESSDYVTGYAGAGFTLKSSLLEVGNIACRGILRSAVFQKDVISAVGGNIAITKSADVLSTDMTALDASTLTIEGNVTFAVNDILRIKDGTDDEWLTVTNVASAPTYTVTRDGASAYAADTNPAWKKGATVVNYGPSGAGGLYLTASESNAPYFSIFTHAGAPWTTLNTRLRLGNLNGTYGKSSATYGIGIGSYTDNIYLLYDTAANTLVVSNIQSPDYVANTTGYKLTASDGLELNTGSIEGVGILETIMVYAQLFSSG